MLLTTTKITTDNVASKDSHSTTPSPVDVIQRLNSLVKTVNVFPTAKTVMVLLNVLMDPMKVKTFAASEASKPMTHLSADVEKTSSCVAAVNVSPRTKCVTVKMNAVIDPMKVLTSAASKASSLITTKNVVATQRPNGPVPTVNVSLKTTSVTVKLNAKTSLMRPTKLVVSRASRSTPPKSVVVKMDNSNVPMMIVSQSLDSVMVLLNVLMDLMKGV
jgi:hypothetical protein